MKRKRKMITLPDDIIKMTENAIEEGMYSGIRSFSGLIEYLLRKEIEKIKRRQER
ncbi:MAG: hypothetical protein QW272_05270 [Candidatus Methanomethylicaceae archaeon]